MYGSFDMTQLSSFFPISTPTKPRSKLASFNNTLGSLNIQHDQQQQREDDIKVELQIPQIILSIVVKRQNQRSSTQNSTIFKYLSKKAFFRFLAERLSSEGVRNLIRNGSLRVYEGGEIFMSEGRRVTTVDILLFGEAYIISHLEKPQKEILQGQEGEEGEEEQAAVEVGARLQQLIQKVGRQARKFRLRWQKSKVELAHLHKENTNVGQDINLTACQKVKGQSFLDLQPLFDYEPKHSRTIAAMQRISVFSIPVEIFYECLLGSYNSQLNQKLKIFRKVPIFDAFENSKLKTLIEKLTVRELRKGQCVYREGDHPSCFYLLIEGQVEISKTIELFSQNPNNLYKNRVQVSRQRNNRHIKVLPYANFHGVYNYKPQRKVITLAQVNPICIFGEEEVLQGKRRQVTARVVTLNAQLYDISLEIMEQLCGKMIGANGEKKMTLAGFLQVMEESLTLKKILFRQNQLSDLVSYQNKSKYSTIFEGQPVHRSRSHKLPRHSLPLPLDDSLQQSRMRASEEAPPQFNNFNYTEFLKDGQQQQPLSGQLNEQEAKVAQLTHVKFSESLQTKHQEKSIRLRTRSKELPRKKATLDSFTTLDSLSNKITLTEPLFTVNYFQRQMRDEKKLYAQAKKKRLDSIYRNSPERISRS